MNGLKKAAGILCASFAMTVMPGAFDRVMANDNGTDLNGNDLNKETTEQVIKKSDEGARAPNDMADYPTLADLTLTKADSTHIGNIAYKLDGRYLLSVSRYLVETGRKEVAINAFTPAEREMRNVYQEQMEQSRENRIETLYAGIKKRDHLMGIVLRVSTAEELAELLPEKHQFSEGEIDFMERCGFTAFAAVAKHRTSTPVPAPQKQVTPAP